MPFGVSRSIWRKNGDRARLAFGSRTRCSKTFSEKTLAQTLDLGFDQPIRVVLGPQADFFSDAEIARFAATDYVVSNEWDRMGFRLDGEPLAHAKGYNIVSDGIVNGSIQVPGSGLPIVLLV